MKPRILPMTMMAVALAGCASSPPVNYYTLLAPAAALQAPAAAASSAYMIDVLPVSVPAQADQPQIMIRSGDGAVTPLYSDRWTAPLGDEIRSALSDSLTRALSAPDVRSIQPAADAPVWRVQVDVQRFDAAAGGPALVDATWRIRPLNLKGATLLCRSVVRMPVSGAGVPALVAGQQHAIQELAATIASGIRAEGERAQAPSARVQLSGCNQNK